MSACVSCGEDSPGGARFCPGCGARLPERGAGLTEERKVVTVLFCDLVGSTARADGADPEDVQATLGPYHARLRTELERYGATVEKFIGDAVMAVFGTPVAHEDDAERAVRAGLRILAAISELNDARPGLDLEVRIGVATGEGLVRLGARPELGQGIVVGDVVNIAARLHSAAPPGGVVVGELTHRLTADDFDYQGLAPVVVKGKAGPLAIWQATGTRAWIAAEVLAAPATPFVGRADELAALRSALGRTVREQAVWGTPAATEGDTERAVRAALDLVAAVGQLGAEAGVTGLAARAGVVTGEVAVTLGAAGEGMVAGDPVNTAARVQSAAGPGRFW